MRNGGNNGNGFPGGGNGNGRVSTRPRMRCAIYTRKSTDENMDNDFNSLDAQREACENYIRSQSGEGWAALEERYDDGACSGANMERPAVQRLLADVEAGRVDAIVIYKIDRLSRSLLDFAKLIDFLDQRNVSLISVTQQFNTTTSMGRLTLNILLSFAQFEREVIAERIRDKVGAARRKGKYMGGRPVLGYDADPVEKKLHINPEEAKIVRIVFKRLAQGMIPAQIADELNAQGFTTKSWINRKGSQVPGKPWNKFHLYRMLNNPIYIGMVVHKGDTHPGEHPPIIDRALWDQVQEILSENRWVRSNRPRGEVPGLLKGVLRCGHCDCTMGPTYSRKGSRHYRYYLCQGAAKKGYKTCPTKSLPADEAERMVVDKLRALLKSPEMVVATFQSASRAAKDRLAEIVRLLPEQERILSRLQAESDRLLTGKGAAKGANFAERFQDLGVQLTQKRDEVLKLRLEKDALESGGFEERDVSQSLTDLDELWDELFPEEQARIIRLLVDRAVVHPDRLDLFVRKEGLLGVWRDMKLRTEESE
jgi:site-specific DNA recombinase